MQYMYIPNHISYNTRTAAYFSIANKYSNDIATQTNIDTLSSDRVIHIDPPSDIAYIRHTRTSIRVFPNMICFAPCVFAFLRCSIPTAYPNQL